MEVPYYFNDCFTSTSLNCCVFSFPTHSARNDLSTVIICETLTTEAFFNPLDLADIRTFPGAAANMRLEVMTAATTVLTRLRLNSFDCMTRIGRRNPGAEPAGVGREDHHISPRCTTSHPRQKFGIAELQSPCPDWMHPGLFRKWRPIAR